MHAATPAAYDSMHAVMGGFAGSSAVPMEDFMKSVMQQMQAGQASEWGKLCSWCSRDRWCGKCILARPVEGGGYAAGAGGADGARKHAGQASEFSKHGPRFAMRGHRNTAAGQVSEVACQCAYCPTERVALVSSATPVYQQACCRSYLNHLLLFLTFD